MRFFVWLLVVASIFWGGYWFVGSNAVEKSAKSAIDTAIESGYSIEYSSLNTTGFPNRFDTTIKDIDVFALSGLRWKAAFFQVFALSYKPYHVIAVWPNEQLVEYQGTSAKISSSDLRASLVVKPKPALELDRFQLTGEDLRIALNEAETYTIKALSAASRQGAIPLSHDFSVNLSNVLMPSPVESTGVVSLESIFFDANFVFDAPIRSGEAPPRLTALTLNKLGLSQGLVDVTLSGALTFDFEGYATGKLTLTAENWQEGFASLERLDAIPEEQLNMVKTVLKGLAATGGSVTDIQAPLRVKRGKIYMGFVPLGVIPPL